MPGKQEAKSQEALFSTDVFSFGNCAGRIFNIRNVYIPDLRKSMTVEYKRHRHRPVLCPKLVTNANKEKERKAPLGIFK